MQQYSPSAVQLYPGIIPANLNLHFLILQVHLKFYQGWKYIMHSKKLPNVQACTSSFDHTWISRHCQMQVTKAKPKEGLWKDVDEKLTKEANQRSEFGQGATN